MCRRQAVWPVYSSVASLPLSLLVPASHLTLCRRAFFSFRLSSRPFLSRTFTVAVALPTFHTCPRRARVRYLSPSACVCDTYALLLAPTLSFVRLGQSFKTGTVPAENVRVAANTPFRRLIGSPVFVAHGEIPAEKPCLKLSFLDITWKSRSSETYEGNRDFNARADRTIDRRDLPHTNAIGK